MRIESQCGKRQHCTLQRYAVHELIQIRLQRTQTGLYEIGDAGFGYNRNEKKKKIRFSIQNRNTEM